MDSFQVLASDGEVMKAGWDFGSVMIGIFIIIAAILIIPLICCCLGVYGAVSITQSNREPLIISNQVRVEQSRREQYQNPPYPAYNPAPAYPPYPPYPQAPYPNYPQPSAPYLQ